MFWTSSTKWEDSLYGGFQKILWDYPSIKTSFDLDYNFDEVTSSLPYSLKTKLADIVQLKIKEFALEKYLISDAEIVEEMGFLGKEKYIVPTKTAIKQVVKYIKNNDPELSSLFKHYENEIINTKLYYRVESDKEDSLTNDGGERTGEKVDIKSVIEGISKETEKSKFKFGQQTGNFSSDFKELKEKTRFVNISLKHPKIEPVRYNKDEEISAQKLLNLLDITFDPKSDKVDNLRNGKLDVAKIATVQSGNTRVYYKVEENISTKPFSICILMDESGSMGHYNPRNKHPDRADHQHSLVKILYKTFSQILPKDKIYIYGHSGDKATHQDPEIRIYHDPYNQKFEECFESQQNVSFNENYDGVVIEKIYDHIRSKTSENILFISISDGYPSGCNYGGNEANDEMKRVIEKCRRDGFVTVGIGFDHSGVKELYSYSCAITDLKESPKIVSTLLNKVVKLEFQNDEC
jgi:hypothetical protein